MILLICYTIFIQSDAMATIFLFAACFSVATVREWCSDCTGTIRGRVASQYISTLCDND